MLRCRENSKFASQCSFRWNGNMYRAPFVSVPNVEVQFFLSFLGITLKRFGLGFMCVQVRVRRDEYFAKDDADHQPLLW